MMQASMTEPQEPALRGDLAHQLATPTSKLRLYAKILADAAAKRGDLAPELLALVPEIPARLLRLAEMYDRIAREQTRTAGSAVADSREPGTDGVIEPSPSAEVPPPSVADPLDSAPARGEGSPWPQRSRPRVLLVEDDPDSRELTRIMLDWDGWEVVTAGDGVAALTLLAREIFDLVLMDCRLPQLDGWTATARLRIGRLNRRIPVIGLTASPDDLDRERGFSFGMNDFIVKPLTEEHVADLRRRYLKPAPTAS